MDTQSGRFVDERGAEPWMPRIAVGEIVNLKGEELEVQEIRERTILLKLLSAAERAARAQGRTGNRHERRRAETLARRMKS